MNTAPTIPATHIHLKQPYERGELEIVRTFVDSRLVHETFTLPSIGSALGLSPSEVENAFRRRNLGSVVVTVRSAAGRRCRAFLLVDLDLVAAVLTNPKSEPGPAMRDRALAARLHEANIFALNPEFRTRGYFHTIKSLAASVDRSEGFVRGRVKAAGLLGLTENVAARGGTVRGRPERGWRLSHTPALLAALADAVPGSRPGKKAPVDIGLADGMAPEERITFSTAATPTEPPSGAQPAFDRTTTLSRSPHADIPRIPLPAGRGLPPPDVNDDLEANLLPPGVDPDDEYAALMADIDRQFDAAETHRMANPAPPKPATTPALALTGDAQFDALMASLPAQETAGMMWGRHSMRELLEQHPEWTQDDPVAADMLAFWRSMAGPQDPKYYAAIDGPMNPNAEDFPTGGYRECVTILQDWRRGAEKEHQAELAAVERAVRGDADRLKRELAAATRAGQWQEAAGKGAELAALDDSRQERIRELGTVMDRWHDDGFYKPAGLWTEAQMVAVLPTIRPIMRRIWPMLLACREGLDLRREARTSEKEPLPC